MNHEQNFQILRVSLSIFGLSFCIGFGFYYFHDRWDLPTSTFYAMQVLLGCNYGVPNETNLVSKWFTLLYYIWGVSLMAGTLASLATVALEYVPQIERKRARRSNTIFFESKLKEFGIVYSEISEIFGK